jgi:hypothetical protein
MGGPAYGYAFSNYLMRLDRGDFVLDVACCSHPITWLRIRLLVNRARKLAYVEMADEVEAHWAQVADSLGVIDDFLGYFEDSWQQCIEGKLDDMLTETSPRPCQPNEATPEREWQFGDTPVLLLNRAWIIARREPATFINWECNAIKQMSVLP